MQLGELPVRHRDPRAGAQRAPSGQEQSPLLKGSLPSLSPYSNLSHPPPWSSHSSPSSSHLACLEPGTTSR